MPLAAASASLSAAGSHAASVTHAVPTCRLCCGLRLWADHSLRGYRGRVCLRSSQHGRCRQRATQLDQGYQPHAQHPAAPSILLGG